MNRIITAEDTPDKVMLFVFVMFYGVLIAFGLNTQSSTEKVTFDKQKLVGAGVEDPSGTALGTITKVIKESSDQAEFAVVLYRTHDESGNATRRFVTVPIAALRVLEKSSHGVNVVTAMSGRRLEVAPFFDPARIEDPKYTADIYRNYGIAPSWTENGTGKPMEEQSKQSP